MRWLVTWMLTAGAAVSGEFTVSRPDLPGVLAQVDWINTRGSIPQGFTVQTEFGSVIFEHSVTANSGAECCADTLEVIALPSGVAAVPPIATIEEGDGRTILIIEHMGF